MRPVGYLAIITSQYSRCFHSQNLANCLVHLPQGLSIKSQQWSVNQTLVVDSAKLINKQVGILVQISTCDDAQAERFGIVYQVGGEQ